MTRSTLYSALIPLSLVGLAACGDPSEGKDPGSLTPDPSVMPPMVSIEPAAPLTSDTLLAKINGSNGGELLFQWYLDGEAVSGLTTATVDPSQTAKGQNWEVQVIERSGDVESDPAIVSTTIGNSPPTVSVTIDPTPGRSGQPLLAEVETSDPDEGDEIEVTFSWSVDGTPTGLSTAEVNAASILPGETWEVTAQASDGEGTAEATASTLIENGPPVITEVTVSPDTFVSGDLLTSLVNAADPDGDGWSAEVTWFIDGSEISNADTLLLDGIIRDQEITLTAVATDTEGNASEPFSAGPFVVSNSLPALEEVTLSPDSPRSSDTISCLPTGWSDADGDEESYTFVWSVNGSPTATTGPEFPAFSAIRGDTISCEVTPFDGIAAGSALQTAEATVQNGLPSAASLTITPLGATSDDELSAVLGSLSDPDGDPVTAIINWTVDGVFVSTGETLPSSQTSPGSEVIASVQINDGLEDGAPVVSEPLIIANTPPNLIAVSLVPIDPNATSTFIAVPIAMDADGQPLSFTYDWLVDGVSVQSGPESQLEPGSFSRGQTVSVTVVANDGVDDSSPVTSASYVVLNAPPTASSVDISPAIPVTGQDLECVATGDDVDGDAVSFTFEWFVNDTLVFGQTGQFLPASDFTFGDVVQCQATPTDGTDTGSALASGEATAGNGPPIIGDLLVEPTPVSTSSDLTATAIDVVDPDGDDVNIVYTWYVDGVPTQVGTTLPATSFTAGQTIVVHATGSDSLLTGPTFISDPYVVQNGRPVVSDLVISPEDAFAESTLTATADITDPDGDAIIGTTYTWFVDGIEVQSGPSADLAPGGHPRGSEVTVSVQAEDSIGPSALVDSEVTLILNTPPQVTQAQIAPQVANETSTLFCEILDFIDPDNDPNASVWTWVVNGVELPPSFSLTGASFDRGDEVECVVTPQDGLDAGIPFTTDPVIIDNSPPSLASAELSDDQVSTSQEISVLLGSVVDLDNDPVSFLYSWQVNGTEVSTEETLAPGILEAGDTFQVTVTPTDGTDTGTPRTSAIGEVVNTPPVVLDLFLDPAAPDTTQDLTVTPVTEDTDGDTVTVSYQWFVESTLVQQGASATLPSTSFSAGNFVWVIATPDDGSTTGAPLQSSTIVVANTPPTLAGAHLEPDPIVEASLVTCVGDGYFDPDEQTPGYLYTWLVNGIPVGNGENITGAVFDKGDSVVCELTPNDGYDLGVAVLTPALTVQNSPPTVTTVSLTLSNPSVDDTIGVNIIAASDPDNDPITSSVQWLVNGAPVSTNSLLSLASYARGDLIQAEVTLSDGTDSATFTTQTVQIVNAPPVIASVTLSPSNPNGSDTIDAIVDVSDSDGDPISLSYLWISNGSPISAQSGPSLPPTAFGKGESIAVQVIANDGFNNSPPSTSPSVTIFNSLPTIDAAVLVPDPPVNGAPLVCQAVNAQDLDGDFITLNYVWTVDNVEQPIATNILPDANFSVGDTVVCTISPYDQQDDGLPVTTGPIVVANTPPTIAGISLNAETIFDGDVLIVTEQGPNDVDGDLISYQYSWVINGTEASTAPSIDGNLFDRGDTIELFVTPFDGTDTGNTLSLGPFTVQNSPPQITEGPSISPSNPRAGDTLTVNATFSDNDGDAISVGYTWRVNGVVAGTGSTLANAFVYTDDVTVELTTNDSIEDGDNLVSDAVLVGNTPPASVSGTYEVLGAPQGNQVTCFADPVVPDPDGQALTYTFTWSTNGSTFLTDITSSPSSTAAVPSSAAVGQLSCSVSVTDGVSSTPNSQPEIILTAPNGGNSCERYTPSPLATDGIYLLRNSAGSTYEAYCDMSTFSGGWTRLVRTTSNSTNFGQNTPAIVSSYESNVDANQGVFEPFRQVTNFNQMMIKQVVGAQAGEYSVFTLVSSSGSDTMLTLLEYCRDEPTAISNDTAFDGARVLGHTSDYSGTKIAGTLETHNSRNATTGPVSHVFICGVNESSDNDISYIAFSGATGQLNDWGDSWRGLNQVDTLWSFANNDYYSSSNQHIGGLYMQGYAGYKGTSGTASTLHTGEYEIFVR